MKRLEVQEEEENIWEENHFRKTKIYEHHFKNSQEIYFHFRIARPTLCFLFGFTNAFIQVSWIVKPLHMLRCCKYSLWHTYLNERARLRRAHVIAHLCCGSSLVSINIWDVVVLEFYYSKLPLSLTWRGRDYTLHLDHKVLVVDGFLFKHYNLYVKFGDYSNHTLVSTQC